MPSRKSLGGNFGEGGGGILTALGLAAPQPSEPATSATPDLETLPPLTAAMAMQGCQVIRVQV